MSSTPRRRPHATRQALALGTITAVSIALTACFGSGSSSAVDGGSATGSLPPESSQQGAGSLGAPEVLGSGASPLASLETGSNASEDSNTLPAPTVVAEGLDVPWDIAFVDAETALVSQRDSGKVVEVADNGDKRVAGVIDNVDARGEAGLHGLTIHEGYLYAYYGTEEDNRVDRFELTGEPGSLGLGEREEIVSGLPIGNVHNGGRIAFGPDGKLYLAGGDFQELRDAKFTQDPYHPAGKILRYNPDGSIPGDNPWPGSPAYSMGHRNVQGLAWTDDGTLYAAEFGQDEWDELNKITAGANYGWPTVEGRGGTEEFTDPVQQWRPAAASPSGMAYADGMLYIANLRGERIRTVDVSDDSRSETHFTGQFGRLRHVEAAPDGSLWVLTNNTDGRGQLRDGDDKILRIELPAGN